MSVEQFNETRLAEDGNDMARLQPQYIQIDDTGDAGSLNTVLHRLNRVPRGTRLVNKAYTPEAVSVSGTGKRAGDIFISGESSAPTNSLNCDGTAVSRTTYATLFARIGTTFGVGDGSTTFNLPDFRRRAPVGKGGTGTGTLGNALGNTGGAETHTLVSGEMPSHTHTPTDPGHAHTIDVYTSGTQNDTLEGGSHSLDLANGESTNNATTGITIGNTGGDGAHNNVQPSLVSSFYIQTEDVSISGGGSNIPLDWYRLPTDNPWTDRIIYLRFNIANVRVLLEVF